MTKYVLEDGDSNRINGDAIIGGPVYDNKWGAVAMQDWCSSMSQFTDPVTVEKYSEEDNNDSSETMNYDFITNDGKESENNDDETQFNTVGSMWTLGDHSTASGDDRSNLSKNINNTIEALDDDIDGDMKAVLQDASELVQETRVSKFECPIEVCGLGHSHADHKHDIRESFAVLDSFANQMDFCPYCHCGVNELSMLMQFFPYISEPVFADQHKFESIYTVEPDVVEKVYREYEGSVDIAVQQAGVAYAEINGAEKDLKLFFERRQEIESAAEAAPIAQETRQDIDSLREELEEVTSQ